MLKSLIEVGEDVVDVLDAYGEADEFGFDASRELLFCGELGVSCGCWMDRERLGISEVGDVGEHFQRVDELGSRFGSTFDSEDHDTATFSAEILLVLGKLGVVFETREADPLDLRVVLKILGDREGVFAVTVHAERKSFDALEELPRVIGRDAGTEIPKWAGAHAENVSQGSEHLREIVSPAEAVVGAIGLVEEGVLAASPVETAGVDHDTAKSGSVSAEPLGEGVDDDVGSVIEGVGEVGRGAGGVDNERKAVGLGDLADGVEVGDFERGIRDGFAKKGARFFIDRVGELLGILGVDEADFDPESRKDVLELGVAAAVEILGGDDVVACFREVDDGIENGCGAGRVSQSRHFVSAFEKADALLEHIGGGIHEAGVNITQLFKCK